ncbi:hypothetical protein EYF80_032693 [Liparis tanakae]|uniref:Uncharacterized protein n=1 Tax=Liparis tanakae TaxID=230148 RepID=A0A4Z2GU34_9TELE|nr:hypothetical protein EYF80_032693 [Liparis tanakae]
MWRTRGRRSLGPQLANREHIPCEQALGARSPRTEPSTEIFSVKSWSSKPLRTSHDLHLPETQRSVCLRESECRRGSCRAARLQVLLGVGLGFWTLVVGRLSRALQLPGPGVQAEQSGHPTQDGVVLLEAGDPLVEDGLIPPAGHAHGEDRTLVHWRHRTAA